ncbi:MAG: LysR family transcriptional regulator [Pseudomonadota bacterium]
MLENNERLYLRVVEAGSLKAAAEQIHADPSAVSRKIAALEDRLGVKLLTRSTRRSVPTEAGAHYYEAMRVLLDQQAALEARIAGAADNPVGRLRVAAPVDFGATFVAPVLHRLHDANAGLQVELLLGSTFSDLVEQGIDVAIRIGRLPDSSLIARRLGAVRRVLVASRAYLEAEGAPEVPEDLAAHPFIFYRPEQMNTAFTMTREGRGHRVQMSGTFCVNSVSAIRDLVAAGKGLHLGPSWVFSEGIADGSIVPVLPEYELEAYPLHALYVPSLYVPAKVRAFIDLMAGTVRGNEMLSP